MAPSAVFFGWFNRTFDRSTEGYANTVSRVLNRGKRLMLVYLAIVIAMAWMFTRIPTAFLPDEDQGILFAQIQTPSGATAERKGCHRRGHQVPAGRKKDAVTSVFAVNGFNFGGRGQNASILFIKLRDWDERGAASLKAAPWPRARNAHFRKTVRATPCCSWCRRPR